jgi:long-chain acyl-CoA synthetase
MNPLLTPGEIAQLVDAAGCIEVTIGDDGLSAPGPAVPSVGRSGGGADEALVLFTSGTTGLPKPVPLTHDAVLARLAAYRPAFDVERPPTVGLMCVPSFHVGGILGLLLSLHGGDTTVVQPRFDAGEWLVLVERNHVESAFLVPTMLARILDHPSFDDTDLSSLRRLAYGAAAAPSDLVRRAMGRLPHVSFSNVFGQTETMGAYTALLPDDHRDPERIGSVGRPMPGVEIRVLDPDTRAPVLPGAVGELWVRSAQNVRSQQDDDGWLRTGDLAHQDTDGYLYPHGRQGDLVNRGGEKFAPAEIARVLRTHPAVRDVAVAGVPDAEMGERVGAAIVLVDGGEPPDRDELQAWCRGRLAPFKQPEIVVYVDELPINELGKLSKRDIVELIEARRDA